MNKTNSTLRFLLPSVLSLLAACAHHQNTGDQTPVSSPAAPAASGPAAQPAPLASGQAPVRSCSADTDCGDRQLCIRSQCVDITPELAECNTVRIHFDFNDVQIHPDDRGMLQRMTRCLKGDHGLHVTIEGNADERGTQEYNLALGDRRATVVATYLERMGVSKAQLQTVSYGKENPLCTEHDEACWSQNRRAALKPKETTRR